LQKPNTRFTDGGRASTPVQILRWPARCAHDRNVVPCVVPA
jgi:hypothetical protein